MSATNPTLHHNLADRAKQITQRELRTYVEKTPGSQAANARAKKVLPLGVPSSLQAYDPHPIVIAKAQGAWMTDVDGNKLIDFSMGFGALFSGHVNPLVRKTIETQLDSGTLFVSPAEITADVAELLREKQLRCFYCQENVHLMYNAVRDAKQWTLDRMDNSFGHNRGNVEIACLICNLRRRTMYHERYVFTKQMTVVKM